MKRLHKIAVGILIFVLAVGTLTVYSYADELDDAKSEMTELEKRKQEIEDKINALESEKGDIIGYIEKLDKQLAQVNEEMDALTEKITQVEENLSITKEELSTAQETERNQYVTMKKRIKYMYENGNSDYIEILMASESIADLLNRSEYISKISEYDHNLLIQYEEVKELVITKEKELETQLSDLALLNGELEAEQQGIQTLMDNKEKELTKFNDTLDDSHDEVQQYIEAISKQEEKIEQILEEERKKAEAKGIITLEEEEIDLSSGLRWPLSIAGRLTSKFGPRKAPTKGASSYHKGIDIAVPAGTPIYATASGKVVTASYQSAAGNYAMIVHGNGMYSAYMHCSKLVVSVGETVKKGQIIAYVGSTGVSTGPHLHFAIIKNGQHVDPLKYVKQP